MSSALFGGPGMAMEIIKNEIIYKGRRYNFMDLEVALSHLDLFSFPFLVPLNNENFVLIEYTDQSVEKAFRKYKDKGLKTILLDEDHYFLFLEKIRNRIKELPNKQSLTENDISGYEKYHALVIDVLKNVGIESGSLNLAKDLAANVIQSTKSIRNVSDFLLSFKRRCLTEYSGAMATAYVASLILQKSPWSTDKIQEKVILGIILSDAILKRSDFLLVESIEHAIEEKGSIENVEIPERVLNHPLEIGKLLRQIPGVEKETISVVEEHHERPNGNGFPKRLNACSISPLSAVHILARSFVNDLFVKGFEKSKEFDVDKNLAKYFKNYHEGNFKLACAGLFGVFVLEKSIIRAE